MNRQYETATPRSPQAFCPNLGAVCANRAGVVRLYSEQVNPHIAELLPFEAQPSHDAGKLGIVLQDYCGTVCTSAVLQPIATA